MVWVEVVWVGLVWVGLVCVAGGGGVGCRLGCRAVRAGWESRAELQGSIQATQTAPNTPKQPPSSPKQPQAAKRSPTHPKSSHPLDQPVGGVADELNGGERFALAGDEGGQDGELWGGCGG